MKKALLNFFERIEPDKKTSPLLHTAYDAFFTFAFAPKSVTAKGVHIRDGIDLKRMMVFVVLALLPLYLVGIYNTGHQHFTALGQYPELMDGFNLKLFYGLVKLLPIFIVTHVVGLGIEFMYAAKRGHAVEEGFLVSGALIPLIMPPDIPLWMLTLAIVFAVIIGKEAFGGTGMNILNVALLARVFVFFAYPTAISGDQVWIAGVESTGPGMYVGQEYGGIYGILDSLFSAFGWDTFGAGGQAVIDGFTGATPLGLAAKGGWEAVVMHYSAADMWWGMIPGSVGETAKPLIILGALFLIFTKIADWRIMTSAVVGFALAGILINMMAPDTITENTQGIFKFMAIPWTYHFFMGSFFFAVVFMATDPVTAASTPMGKIIYGFFIGFVGLIIRILNPAYPEGWMLAILFMNVFAPLIDYYVLEANVKRRAKRQAQIAK